mmetsp:Transcript_19584/g.43670  ORF Transcript_19584/g.43670 Transcript_19584/m.43670 type:complete len:205 (-) Transcript_19584:3991-4605(-)
MASASGPPAPPQKVNSASWQSVTATTSQRRSCSERRLRSVSTMAVHRPRDSHASVRTATPWHLAGGISGSSSTGSSCWMKSESSSRCSTRRDEIWRHTRRRAVQGRQGAAASTSSTAACSSCASARFRPASSAFSQRSIRPSSICALNARVPVLLPFVGRLCRVDMTPVVAEKSFCAAPARCAAKPGPPSPSQPTSSSRASSRR